MAPSLRLAALTAALFMFAACGTLNVIEIPGGIGEPIRVREVSTDAGGSVLEVRAIDGAWHIFAYLKDIDAVGTVVDLRTGEPALAGDGLAPFLEQRATEAYFLEHAEPAPGTTAASGADRPEGN